MYTQCVLKKGNTQTVAWIESKYAILNKKLKMKKDDGSWDRGPWIVSSIGKTINWDQLKLVKDNYRNHREATDI